MSTNINRKSIAKTLAFIEKNLDQELNLDELAKMIRISKYHFHRMFKEHMGITIGQYIKLKRLENSMWRMVYTEAQTLEIALNSGYQDHSAFSRSFKKEFGYTPKEFKHLLVKQKEKTMSLLSKESPTFLGIKDRKETNISYVRKKGSYFVSAIQAWDQLLDELKRKGVSNQNKNYYGIAHDDPHQEYVKEDDLRFDACIELTENDHKRLSADRVQKGTIPGGTFAVFLHKGPLEKLGDSYHYIYGKWVYENDRKLANNRIFLKYRDLCFNSAEEKNRETEIYLPILPK